jgi:hypothetical protein
MAAAGRGGHQVPSVRRHAGGRATATPGGLVRCDASVSLSLSGARALSSTARCMHARGTQSIGGSEACSRHLRLKCFLPPDGMMMQWNGTDRLITVGNDKKSFLLVQEIFHH